MKLSECIWEEAKLCR